MYIDLSTIPTPVLKASLEYLEFIAMWYEDTMQSLFMIGQQRKLLAVCDNDQAGRRLAKFGHVSHLCDEGHDVGDSSDQWVYDVGCELIGRKALTPT